MWATSQSHGFRQVPILRIGSSCYGNGKGFPRWATNRARRVGGYTEEEFGSASDLTGAAAFTAGTWECGGVDLSGAIGIGIGFLGIGRFFGYGVVIYLGWGGMSVFACCCVAQTRSWAFGSLGFPPFRSLADTTFLATVSGVCGWWLVGGSYREVPRMMNDE